MNYLLSNTFIMHLKHYLAKFLLSTLIVCCCLVSNGQQIIQEKINQQFATAQDVATYTPFTAVEANALKSSVPETVLSKKQFFQIQAQQFQSIKGSNAEQLVLSLPIEGQQVEFQLIQADIFSDDFQAVAASGVSLSQDMGAHYWGTVTGDANSFAAFSFIQDELIGNIQFGGAKYTLGKIKNSDTHILYNNADLKNDTEYECQELLPPGMNESDMPPIDALPLSNSVANCVNIHMEVDHSVFLAANSDATATTNYIAGLFSQVAALYINESIAVQISYMQVWDTPSPYGNGTELDDLVAQGYGKTQGDLVHVIHMNGLRGLAYRNVICNNFVNAAASGIQGSYNDIPIFSWDVEVVTHEIGHNLGSPHTHGCYWNGDSTAIDGCGPAAGYDEGCDAALPTSGTIMSYCHLVGSVGIDFNLGFGQQPGDLIRSRVSNAFCLTECTVSGCPNGNPGDTCDDSNACTVNDAIDENCNCVGTFADADSDGVCDNDDICPGFDDTLIGTACDDGDACTTGDIYTQNCECAGTFADADGDGVCDADDICEFGDDNLDTDGDGTPDACDFSNGSMDTDQDGVPDDEDVCPGFDDNLIGTPCDDDDVCTENDMYTQNCICEGTLIDANGNGVCDADESAASYDMTFSVAEVDCQNQTISIDFAVQATNAGSGFNIADQNYRMSFDRALANPTIVQELGLSGIYPLASSQFALYSPHSLLGSMDTVISYNIALQTNNGFPITTTPVPVGRLGFDIVDDSECFEIIWHTPEIYPSTVIIEEDNGALIPINNGNFNNLTICLDEYCAACDVGATCDDGDVCTTNDVINENCECAGELADADGDGVCDDFDICPDFDDDLFGTPCDDGDPCTIDDSYFGPNCECVGILADADQDGVCDEDDVCAEFDDTLIGTSCDDNNDCTVDDVYTENCECEGTYLDSDEDGFCDAEDICPDFDDELIGTPCDDGDACTVQDVYGDDCECVGTFLDSDEDGVCDAEDICPQFDDTLIGTACDDGDECTIDDVYTENCECEGTFFDNDGDGVCDIGDCPDFDDTLIGTACDDGDDCTVDDIYTPNCECAGTFLDSDQDGVCDAEDICPEFNDELIGTSCDDGDVCTVQDVYGDDCECAGTYLDSDEDGVCDEEDICPEFDNALIGTPCDDNNDCTVDDVYTENCECEGTFADADEDGFCDAEDVCPEFNDELIGTPCDDGDACTVQDVYGDDCECAGTYLDSDEDGVCDEEDICPGFDDSLIGTACDDGDDCTIDDTYVDCGECMGTYLDSDEDGFCDAEDICPDFDDELIGTPCDDGDACTVQDVYGDDCECAGTYLDSDEDGVCDEEDICPDGDDNIDTNGNGTPDACEPCVNTASFSIESRISSGEDDVEERESDGNIYLTSSDLELVFDNYQSAGNQHVGLLFRNLNIPQGAVITNAYVQFTVDEADSGTSSLNIAAQDTDNAASFSTTNYDVSNRTQTTASVAWAPSAWTSAGTGQQTPDISSVIQEVVNRSGWSASSNLAIIITGTGERTAESYDGSAEQAPIIYVEYTASVSGTGDADGDGICDESDICPEFDDTLIGTACDDGDDCTVDDVYTENCECAGTYLDTDEDGVCDTEDVCPDFDDELIGTACDDGDDCTIDDTYVDCECVGTFADTDEDGICDAEDNTNGDCTLGAPCDDGDPCTLDDFYDENCNCISDALSPDTDNDGLCDVIDECPELDNDLIGTACDDGDDCTVDDVYTEDCECVGILVDTDEDGVCDTDDICPELDDNLIGTPCDDGNACTVQDIYTENCECAGTYLDSDEDGVCDEEDACPVLDNSLIGTPCDDGDTCTTGDIYTPNCECAGTFADGDGDGVCDADDICEFGDDNLDSDGDGIPDACDFFDDTDSDGDGVPDSEDICPGGDDNIDTDGNGTPDACEDCPTFNFIDYPVGTYGNNQDRGTVTTSDDGTSIELNDNAWKAIVVNYEITPYTVIEFDFKSTQIGEIHGVGFDNNTSISSGKTFKLYGTQNWGNSTFNNYSGSGEYEHFVIPVGEFYTGEGEYFFFVGDHDAAPQDGNSFFANLKIYEDANGDGLCDSPDDCADADGDTVCDDDDICPAGDDTIDTDGDGAPDACDLCPNDADDTCDTTPDYCESTGFNTDYEYIDRVVFGNVDNTSGNDGGYGDFTNQVVTVGLGDIVPLGLTPGFTGSPYNEGWRVWIDFNKDGDFNDDGERVFSGNGAGVLSSTVEIPADAALGLTGMRVSMRWNRFMNPCSDFAYGEVEDYTVNITAEAQNYPPLDLRGEEYFVESPALRIFPNPATEYININFQNIREGGSIAIYSTSGQLIGTQAIDAEHLYVPLNNLPAGVYILHLRYGDDTYATERFVKLSN